MSSLTLKDRQLSGLVISNICRSGWLACESLVYEKLVNHDVDIRCSPSKGFKEGNGMFWYLLKILWFQCEEKTRLGQKSVWGSINISNVYNFSMHLVGVEYLSAECMIGWLVILVEKRGVGEATWRLFTRAFNCEFNRFLFFFFK